MCQKKMKSAHGTFKVKVKFMQKHHPLSVLSVRLLQQQSQHGYCLFGEPTTRKPIQAPAAAINNMQVHTIIPPGSDMGHQLRPLATHGVELLIGLAHHNKYARKQAGRDKMMC
jgi:hypothetical protein